MPSPRYSLLIANRQTGSVRRLSFARRPALIAIGTVASTAAFIGLFGTVLGIIQAFHDLSLTSEEGAKTVMSGISEALVATAMGLFAAIPAVIAYNRFSSRVDSLVSNYDTFSEEFSSILHRQAHAVRKTG